MGEEEVQIIAAVFLGAIVLGFIFAGLCEFRIIQPFWWR